MKITLQHVVMQEGSHWEARYQEKPTDIPTVAYDPDQAKAIGGLMLTLAMLHKGVQLDQLQLLDLRRRKVVEL